MRRYHWEDFNFSAFKDADFSVDRTASVNDTPTQLKARKAKDTETPKQPKTKTAPKKKLYSQPNQGPQILEGSEGQVPATPADWKLAHQLGIKKSEYFSKLTLSELFSFQYQNFNTCTEARSYLYKRSLRNNIVVF